MPLIILNLLDERLTSLKGTPPALAREAVSFAARICANRYPGYQSFCIHNNPSLAYEAKGMTSLLFSESIENGLPGLARTITLLSRILPPNAFRSEHLVLLSPLHARIGHARIDAVEAAFHLEPSRITISAQKLHHNKHPSWAWGTDRSTGADGAMILTTPAQPALLRGNVTSELRDFFPDLDEIRGSQWLPELYDADGAVACVPSVFLEGKRGVDDQNFSLVFCEEEPGPDAPILYRLNSL